MKYPRTLLLLTLACALALGVSASFASASDDLFGGPEASSNAQTDFALSPEVLAEINALKPKQLEHRAEQLRVAGNAARSRLAALVAERDAQDSRVDVVLESYADRLAKYADSLVAGEEILESETLQVLLDARDITDPDVLQELIGQLPDSDQKLLTDHVAALELVVAAEKRVNLQEQRVQKIEAEHTYVKGLLAGSEPARTESIRADYVFTTGPIPSIGYWGDVTGGGILTGWTAMASAAMGGLGCAAPDPALKASGQIESGEASWYGPGFHGNNTANGEVYDQNTMTAAHKTLPFGTIVKVFSPSTGGCAFVRINDRGPFIEGRIIDLSHAAAQAIGMSGVAPVTIEVWA